MRRIEGWGNKRARLVILGEAPGEREENVGQPFVGPAGFRLNEWMARVGLSRASAFIDNVYQHRPPGNAIKAIDRITLEQWMGYLHERIAELDDPWVIVPTGNYALYALTGKGKVHWHMRDGREARPGVLDWRGSILEYTDLRGRVIKCIPTIHPAATFRQPSLERACVVDWERIAAELAFRDLRRPLRTHHIYPSLSQLASLHQSACEPGAILSIDIENPRGEKTVQVQNEDGSPARYKSGKRKGHVKSRRVKGEPKIVCVGFSLSPTESITVPTELSYWKTEDRLTEAWQWIRHLCTSPAEKVLHNGLYDTFFLADHGIKLVNWKWDTLYMHHCLTGDTKVLMGDLTWKRLDEIEIGSELASFDESAPGGHRRLRLSRVTAVSSRMARTHEVGFSNGETICGTRDHRFLVGRRERHGRANGGVWKELHELQAGDEVWSIGRPWTVRTDYDAGWLAGFYDGEGSVDHRLKCSVAQNPGATLEYAKSLLQQAGFEHSEYVCRDARVLVLTGGVCQFLKFLGQIRPQRLLTKVRAFLKKGAGDSQYIRGNAVVAGVRSSGYSRKVFDISTTTRTFIANGILVHNCLDASAPHDLAYCASVDTREPYWKSEAKDPDEIGKYTSNWAAFLTYNGKDCCVTRELCDIYKSRLAELSLHGTTGLDFYLQHYVTLLEPLLDLERHGIRVDATKRKYRLMELMANCIDLQDRLTGLSGGVSLYGTTSLSTTKLKKYLYDQLALPKQWRKRKDTGEKTETVDEVAVRRLMERHPACQPLQATGPLMLEHRHQQTLLHFYKTERIDDDGRYRSSYSPNTEAGRLSSSRNPRGTGSNAQNVSREARDIFLADAGMVGVEVDASQAEARIDYLLIYMLTKDRSVLDKARLRPDEYDQHTENAAAIFGKVAATITKEERYLGKKAVHAAFRDMQGQKLADELLKEGRIYSAEACDKLIKAFRNRLGVGYIEELFRWIRGRIIQDRYLENSWGRRLWFEYDRLDDEAYRRGYSFDPQSEVADLINQRGLIPLHTYLRGTPGRINAHVHDSLFFSVPREMAYETTKFLVNSLEQSRTYWGVDLVMPCTVKVGGRWKTEKEWQRLPTREEFESVVATLQLVP